MKQRRWSILGVCLWIAGCGAQPASAHLPPSATGDLYVGNYNGDNILVYAPDGTFLRSFTGPGLNGPRGIVFVPAGNLYIASELTDEVFVFAADETYLTKFSYPDPVPGSPNTGLDGPTGMALGPDHASLYVSSFNTDRVFVFDLNGAFLRSFSPPTASHLNGPNCVAFGATGNIYVTSALTATVLKFDAGESYLFSFTGGGLVSPMSVARDENDVLYISGGSSHNIAMFDTTGSFLGQVTHPDLTGPQGVAFDDRGHMFSSSFFQSKIVEFDTTGAYVQTITAGGLNVPRSIAFQPLPGPPVPTLSQWGAVVMAILLAAAGTLVWRNIRSTTQT